MTAPIKTLWELLWDYDPNGLIAVDPEMNIRVVNRTFCRMFRVDEAHAVGRPASEFLGDVSDLRRAWETKSEIRIEGRMYPAYDLYVSQVLFSIEEERITACILVDMTHEWRQREEILELRRQTLEKVNEVVDNQMKVAQEIAGLLGEATAETKVSLLKLIELVQTEAV